MPNADKQGRSYVELEKLTDCQSVWLDGGFTCHKQGCVTVHVDSSDRSYFECDEGKHYLDGQCDDDSPHCVSVYKDDPGTLLQQA